MVPWNPATLAFPFGAVDQGKGSRHLLAGEMTEAINVRQVLEEQWRKRPGFDRTVCSTFVGGTPSGTPKEYAIVGGSDMWRDGTDQVWSRDSDGNVGYYRGKQQRVFPEHFGVDKVAPSHEKPLAVLVGGDLWVFSRERYPAGTTAGSFSLSVYDATTRVRKMAPTTVNLSGSVVAIHGWAAAYDSANSRVWLMVVGLTTFIESYRFTSTSPSTAPTVTTYRNVASRAFNAVDIKKLSNNECLVVASSFVAATPHQCYFEHSYLDASTGAARVAPGPVGTATTPANPNPRCCTGIRLFANDFHSGGTETAFYTLWRTKAGATNEVQLIEVEVNQANLTISSGPNELILKTGVTQTADPIVGTSCGFRNASTGDRTAFAQLDPNDTTRPDELLIERAVWNGAAATVTPAARQAWLASDPFNQGASTEWFFVTGYDDGQNTHAQRTHFLRNQDGAIVSQFLPGEAGPAWHQAVGRDSGGGAYNHATGFINAAVNPSSGKWMVAVAAEDSANECADTRIVELDFSETYAPPVVIEEVAQWNGPIPQVAGPRDNLHDLGPLLFPSREPTFGLGSGAALGTFRVAYCFRFRDSSSRIYRSAPSAIATAAFLDAGSRQAICQSLNHIGAGTAQIEVYGSLDGGDELYLQQVGENDTDANTSTVVVTPERWTSTGELLATTGNALSNAPPPACRCSTLWRGRLFLSGTPVHSENWFSQEMQAGRGPEFNETLVADWPEGTGAPELLVACDWNYLSVHKADAVAVLSGPGPDGRGQNGNYLVATLSGHKAARVGSAVTGPAGAYFQNRADGRICLLPPGSPAVDIGRGVESHRGTNVVAALHVESERAVWFHLSDGKVLALNYAFPTASSPFGRWSVYNGPSLAAVGAAMNGTTPRYLEASSTVAFRSPGATWVDANAAGNADVLKKISLSKLRPVGHQVEMMVDRCYFEGQHLGASSLRITVTNDLGQTETFTRVGTASPLDYMVTPGGQTMRTKEFGISIEETASGTEGFVFDTFAADVKTLGKLKVPNAGNWIAPG